MKALTADSASKSLLFVSLRESMGIVVVVRPSSAERHVQDANFA